MTSRKLIICLLASMVMRRLLLLKMRHISFLMLSVFPPIIYTSLYSYCIILRKSNYSLYIYIYIYRKSASRFSRGTVLNTLKQSRIIFNI